MKSLGVDVLYIFLAQLWKSVFRCLTKHMQFMDFLGFPKVFKIWKFLGQFLLTTSKVVLDIYHQKHRTQVAHGLPDNLRVRILKKGQNWVGVEPSV